MERKHVSTGWEDIEFGGWVRKMKLLGENKAGEDREKCSITEQGEGNWVAQGWTKQV